MDGCGKCKKKGCETCGSDVVSINDICNPIVCDDGNQCSDSHPAQCTFYTGPNIMCGNVIIIPEGTNIAQAMANMVAYFCNAVANPVPQGIIMYREGNLFNLGAALQPMITPFTLTSADFPNNDDGIEMTFFLRMSGDTVPEDNTINLNGVPFVTIPSQTTPSTNEVTFVAFRQGSDLMAYCTVKGFMDSHSAQEQYEYALQSANFFLNTTNTISITIGDTTSWNNITIKKLLKVQ